MRHKEGNDGLKVQKQNKKETGIEPPKVNIQFVLLCNISDFL